MIVGQRKAISNWIWQFKTIVDIKNNVYKLQQSFMGIFSWGSFKTLPKVNYVLVFKSFYAKCETCTIDDKEDNPNSFFQISIVYNTNRRIIVHETKSRTDGFDFAKTLAMDLKTRVLDSATQKAKSVWLK